jgi:hypothetical protein
LSCGLKELNVPPENVVLSHYGYVYSMALSPSHLYGSEEHSHDEEVYLFTGSGDEEVKVGFLAHRMSILAYCVIDVVGNKGWTVRETLVYWW